MTCINGITKEKGDSNIWKSNYKVNLIGSNPSLKKTSLYVKAIVLEYT